MMRLPVSYEVEAWRPLDDVINELTDTLLSTPITSCELSVRTLNLCLTNGISTLGDLTKISKTDLLKFRNFGKKSLAELDDILKDNGLDWETF